LINTNKQTEKAVLVHIDFRRHQFSEEFEEFIQLVDSSGLSISQTITGSRDVPAAKYFVGTGKLEEIKLAVQEFSADVVIFNHALSPAQERNLEQGLKCRVLDRVGLILDIFSQRARSYEGKLQVELAQLQHLSTRLVRGWSHLERQKGGIGLRGPGETQLETDRQLVGKRIKTINTRLQKVQAQHKQGRRLRHRTETPVVSLVGYTNAGKSTLFNTLTGADTYVADKLFATLDTTLRKVDLSPGNHIVLSDTVGFIRHIPHDLIDSFHATLEEVKEADLLLHVVDVNDDQRETRMAQVNEVIDQIGASDVPQILVFNKIDMKEGISAQIKQFNGAMPQVWLSAVTGEGVAELKEVMEPYLSAPKSKFVLCLPITASKLRASLFQQGAVIHEETDPSGNWLMHVSLEGSMLERICRNHGHEANELEQSVSS
jgi:GTP-binding protein HflX